MTSRKNLSRVKMKKINNNQNYFAVLKKQRNKAIIMIRALSSKYYLATLLLIQ